MIRIMAPDLAHLSGGLAVIYDLVEQLNRLGHPAVAWHGSADYRVPGGRDTAQVDRAEQVWLEAGDVLVMTELGGDKWSSLNPEVPVVMLVQGIDFVCAGTDVMRPLPGAYPGWPQATAAIATSHAISAFLRSIAPDLTVHHVPVSIDAELYRPAEKRRQVSFMPRRRPEDLSCVIQLLHRHGRLEDWSLRAIDQMTPDQVARELGRSAIFLAGGEREGFGLPGAEAMAAGAHVVGFAGLGALEYMRDGLAEPIEDSDVVAMAEAVERAMDLFDADRPAFDARAAAARRSIVDRYNPQAQGAALASAMAEILAPGSAAPVRERRSAVHYQVHAPSTSAWGRARVAGRSAAGKVARRLRG